MIEVFITSIQTEIQIRKTSDMLKKDFPELRINFDLDESNLPFPCGHTILRTEGNTIITKKIISKVNELGFNCEILEDKVCT